MKKSRRTPEELRSLIAEKIPEGSVVPEHTNDSHWYRHLPSGLLLPSVTTITGIMSGGQHLRSWSARLATDYIEQRIESFSKLDLLGRSEIYKAAVLAHQDTLQDAGGVGTQGHRVIEKYTDAWIESGLRPDDITTFISSITGEDHRVWAIARSAQKFFIDYMVIPVVSEQKVVRVWMNQKTGYAGTLDNLSYVAFPLVRPRLAVCVHDMHANAGDWTKLTCFRCNGRWQYKLTLVDYKSSNSIMKFPTPEGMQKQLKDDYTMQTVAYDKAFHWMTGIKVEEIVVVRLDKAKEDYEVGRVIDRAGAFKAFMGLKNARNWIEEPTQKSITLETKERVTVDSIL